MPKVIQIHRTSENLSDTCRVTNCTGLSGTEEFPRDAGLLSAKARTILGNLAHPRYMLVYNSRKMTSMWLGILGFLISTCRICVLIGGRRAGWRPWRGNEGKVRCQLLLIDSQLQNPSILHCPACNTGTLSSWH